MQSVLLEHQKSQTLRATHSQMAAIHGHIQEQVNIPCKADEMRGSLEVCTGVHW
jgi:hypothetical protein